LRYDWHFAETTFYIFCPTRLACCESNIEQEAPMSKVNHIPAGFHSATPYLLVRGASQAIEFYQKVFGAAEIMRMPQPNGRIAHAEIKIGDSFIMLADEFPERGFVGPQTYGGTTVGIMLYVDNVDRTFADAIANGASVLEEVNDKFYGDRSGSITDPFGHRWTIATHVEDVAPEEMQRRMAAMPSA
jgi:PhnB protein